MTESTGGPTLSPTARLLYSVGTVLLFGVDLLLQPPGRDPAGGLSAYRVGSMVGAGVMLVLLVAIVAWALRTFRKGKPHAPLPQLAFWTLAGYGLVTFLGLLGRRPTEPAVTESERNGLAIEADTIRHPLLGFVLPNPGPAYHTAPEIQTQLDAQFKSHPGAAAWALKAEGQGVVAILVSKFAALDEKGFRDFVTSLRRGFVEAGKGAVQRDSVSWSGAGGEYRLGASHPSGVLIELRCTARAGTNHDLIACVEIAGKNPAELSGVLDGLTLSP